MTCRLCDHIVEASHTYTVCHTHCLTHTALTSDNIINVTNCVDIKLISCHVQVTCSRSKRTCKPEYILKKTALIHVVVGERDNCSILPVLCTCAILLR